MGTYVAAVVAPVIPSPAAPDKIHTEGNFDPGNTVNPTGPWLLVQDRFETSMATAEMMLNKLVGGNGETGYLNDLQDIIDELSSPSITGLTYNNVALGSDFSAPVLSPPVSGDTVLPDFALTTYASPSAPALRDGSFAINLPSVPVFSSEIDTDFADFTTPAPTMVPIPDIDLSGLTTADMPDELVAAVSWFEEAHDTSLYTPLFNRLLTDLQSGASGIGGTIEQEIYDRALARQNIEEDRLQTEIEEYFASTGFDLPTGAMAARLQEHANARSLRSLDLNGKIMIEQAELAQKNSQFVIEAARNLEAVLRDYATKKNDRSLDYSKAVAANAVAIYAENIKRFVAALEGNKNYIQLQVEILRAAIETNKAAVEVYSAEAKVYEVSVDAKAKKNEAITEVYKAEIQGYSATTGAAVDVYKAEIQGQDSINSALTERYKADVGRFSAESGNSVEVYKAELAGNEAYNRTIVDTYKAEVDGYSAHNSAIAENHKNILQGYALKIQDADNDLKAAIAQADGVIRGYGTEYSLREKVAEAMANVAMQAMASAYGAVNSSAGLSYSAGESVSESWSHGETRSDSYSHSESLSTNQSVSLGNSLSESHDYKHDTV